VKVKEKRRAQKERKEDASYCPMKEERCVQKESNGSNG
jgi:hypothetical protein